jgi:hypothetical protein
VTLSRLLLLVSLLSIPGCAAISSHYEPFASRPVQATAPVSVPVSDDSRLINLTLFIGGAFPSHDAPQGPNLAGASLGVEIWKQLVLGVDLSVAGTSERLDPPQTVNKLSWMWGLAASYRILDWAYLTLEPAYHRIRYTEGGQLNTSDAFIATGHNFKLGVGVGLHYGGVMLDARAFPALHESRLPAGQVSNTTLYQIRLGYNGDIEF